MVLSSPRFAPIQQCRDAANNSPPMNAGTKGLGVAAAVQQKDWLTLDS
jgi:hypothetical protein